MSCSPGSESSFEADPVKQALQDALLKCKSPGSFATSSSYESFPPPGITIEGLGSIAVPLSVEDARRIFEHGSQAPFGKGSRTLTDASVRKTKEVDAARISFTNDAWQPWLEGIVVSASEALGMPAPASAIRAEPYKLLVYDKTCHFKPHRDSQKSPGMFGTLVICLPSAHEGGATRLTHGSTELVFNSDQNSAFGLSYMAWYADISHEIRPLLSGYRVVLTYNLVCSPWMPNTTAAARLAEHDQLTKVLKDWNDEQKSPLVLCWLLEHKISQTDLRLANLKGNDFHRACALLRVCKDTGLFDIFLAQLERVVSRPNDEGEDESEKIGLEVLADLQGTLLWGHRSISTNWIVQEQEYKGQGFEERLGGEYVGNQHVDFEFYYLNTVIVIVPKTKTLALLHGARFGKDQYQKFMESLSTAPNNIRGNNFPRELIRRSCLLPLEPVSDNTDQNQDSCLGVAFLAASRNRESELSQKLSNQIRGGLDSDFFTKLGSLLASDPDCVEEHTVVDLLHKVLPLHKFWTCINNFCSRASQMAKTDSWLADQHKNWAMKKCLDHMAQIRETCGEDSKCICDLLEQAQQNDWQDRIQPFVLRFKESRNFTYGLVAAKLREQAGSEKVYPLVSNQAAILFDLRDDSSLPGEPVYYDSSVVDDSIKGEDRERANLIKSLYLQLLTEGRRDDASMVLSKVQGQLQLIPSRRLGRFVIPVIQCMVPILTADLEQAKSFCKCLLTEFLVRAVQNEPSKPQDWTREEDAGRLACHQNNCEDCPLLRAYLMDPAQEFYEMKLSSWQHTFGLTFYLESTEHKDKDKVTLQKTTRSYKIKAQEWERRAKEAESLMAQLPRAPMAKILGEEYEDILALHPVRRRETPTSERDKRAAKRQKRDR